MAGKDDDELVAMLKAKVALAAMRGDQTLTELAAQYGLDPAQIEEWKKGLEAAFRSDGPPSGTPAMPDSPPLTKTPTVRPPTETASMASLPPLMKTPTVRPPTRAPAMPDSPSLTKTPTIRPPTIRPLPPLDDDPPTVPLWPSGPKAAEPETVSGGGLDDEYWADATMVPRSPKPRVTAEARVTPVPRAKPAPSWTHRLLGVLFVRWRERHHAAKTSRELMKLYRATDAAYPGLKKQQLYRQIVMVRLGGSSAAADALLVRAKESFATWPVDRALTFRDVVHYIAVSDYLASTDHAEDWTRENLGRVVAKLVSDDL
jgi:hypothetical protein